MKLAVLISPLHQLKPYKDTTVAMIKSAQALGWSCVFFTASDLFCVKEHAYAQVYDIEIGDEHSHDWAKIKPLGERPLSTFDIILMRQDPPWNIDFIYATYALELAEREGVLVVNKPASLRDVNEKWFTLHFPQCCPDTLVSQNIERLRDFWKKHKQVVYKPMDAMGGRSIFCVFEKGENLSVILEMLTQGQSTMIMAQTYIPEVLKTGDKRILLIDGKPIDYALARTPAPGEMRANLSAGGKGKVVKLTSRDRWLCQEIGPTLVEKGLRFVGIDVISGYITEINVTSPTCAREIMAETGLDITGDFLRGLARGC